MKINILGGGPAGLYFAILLKKRDPSRRITIVERDGPDDTFGWGIVFSERTLGFLKEHDTPTYAAITAACQTWDNVDVIHKGEKISVNGNGFSGIGRLAFLHLLHRRARELGAEIRFNTPVDDIGELADCDLLLGADGANSLVRRTYPEFFQPTVDIRQNRYIWPASSRMISQGSRCCPTTSSSG